jgi:deoxyribodipyrimidine photo-lyase
MEVVWFKRDLRAHDHAPLARAASRGEVLCLFVYEPELINSPEFDSSHLDFINDCLAGLDGSLRARGGRLVTRVGAMPRVLEEIWNARPFTRLWSHQETGNGITYARDTRVRGWCRERGVEWIEPRQSGVVRRLRSRDGWARGWEEWAAEPCEEVPARIRAARGIPSEGRKDWADFGLPASQKETQPGGENRAVELLETFLAGRGARYRRAMSSPITAADACSRLSPHLAWGSISIRRVERAAVAAAVQWQTSAKRADPEEHKLRAASLRSFRARLRWHCHFMQKLEDEPALEFHNLHPAYDGLRPDPSSSSRSMELFQAWQAGLTGFPMVDACMRFCRAAGWLNFRMRAMLASFAAYHLWLHWREPAVFLARHFLDFEPGIHFSQFQMQSGTTGINTLRIYSPTKQGLAHDPDGRFIRHWVPELADLPPEWIHQPHLMPLTVRQRHGFKIGRQYPPPIVDHSSAWRRARTEFAKIRNQPETRARAREVYRRHGSRKDRRRAELAPLSPAPMPPEMQTEFDFDL